MAETSNKTLLEWALEYHARGWSIIPIGFGKAPPKGVKWKDHQRTRPTETKLREWFGSGTQKGLAVVCGAVSGGLCVLDLDSEQRCRWWRETHPQLAKTLPSDKTKKGLHVHFRCEPFRKQNGDEVDLLCEGAYAILPPSPGKKWVVPLSGELPLLNPFEWGLEQFGIKEPEKEAKLPEDTEDTEDSEDTDDTERQRSHKVEGGFLDSLDKSIKDEIEKAIEHTLPNKQKQRNTAILPLCQWLKAIPELRDLPAKELKPIVVEWHRRAYHAIGTKSFTTTWADFVHAWKRVKWPKGEIMLSHAVRKALEADTIPPEVGEYDEPGAQLLLRVCYWLGQSMGDEPFFLASRTAGGIIGASHRTAYKLLEMFVEDGKLKVEKKHTEYRATRFRYVAN